MKRNIRRKSSFIIPKLRILTGKPGITLVSVKTQYVISKVTSHGARLDVLAEDAEKTLYHLEIEGAAVLFTRKKSDSGRADRCIRTVPILSM